MAIINNYVNADILAGRKASPIVASSHFIALQETFSVDASDDDGSIYRIFKAVPFNLIPVSITITNGVITLGTDYDLGLYLPSIDGVPGDVKDAQALSTALDMSTGRAEGGGITGLLQVGIGNIQSTIATLAGDTETLHFPAYDIAFTANTVGSVGGIISVKAIFIQP